jgi:hypothetical protein
VGRKTDKSFGHSGLLSLVRSFLLEHSSSHICSDKQSPYTESKNFLIAKTMHYIFLKNIVQTLLENHTCPQCSTKPSEQSIKIGSISENTIDIYINCPSCSMESHLNAQINATATQMLESEQGRKLFDEFLKK